jgi:hypothetical protein
VIDTSEHGIPAVRPSIIGSNADSFKVPQPVESRSNRLGRAAVAWLVGVAVFVIVLLIQVAAVIHITQQLDTISLPMWLWFIYFVVAWGYSMHWLIGAAWQLGIAGFAGTLAYQWICQDE